MHNQHTSTIKAPLTSQNHHNPSSVPNESASTPDRVNPQGSPKLLFTNTLSERIRFVSNCQSSACYLTAQHNPTTLSFSPPRRITAGQHSVTQSSAVSHPIQTFLNITTTQKKKPALCCVCACSCVCVCGLRLKQQRQLSGDKEKDDLHDFCTTHCWPPPFENNNSGYLNP